MAILKMFSFDNSSNAADLGLVSVGAVPSTTKKRTGPQSIKLPDQWFGSSLQAPLTTSSTRWVQFALLHDKVGIQKSWVRFGSSICVGQRPDNSLGLWLGDQTSDPLIAYTSGGLAVANSWAFLEIDCYHHSLSGTVKIKWNGVTVIDYVGNTGASSGPITITSDGGGDSYFDDMIIGDGNGGVNTTTLGDARVEYIPPNAAGASSQFTPTSGANYTTVSETGTSNDATYNSSMSVGAMDLFGMQDLGGSGIVHAVQTVIRSRKDDAGTRTIRPVIRKDLDADGDTPRLYAGPTSPVTDSSTNTTHLMPLSPFTGTAWSLDEVNEAQFGYMIGGSEIFTVSAEIAAF